MGYTVRQAPDQIGFGLSISEVSNCYAQNTKDRTSIMTCWAQEIARRTGGCACLAKMSSALGNPPTRVCLRTGLGVAEGPVRLDGELYFKAERALLEAYQGKAWSTWGRNVGA